MDVLLYTRRGCHLCETVEEILSWHVPAARVVDVGGDAALERDYGLRVPVLLFGGHVVAEGRIEEDELTLLLARGVRDRD